MKTHQEGMSMHRSANWLDREPTFFPPQSIWETNLCPMEHTFGNAGLEPKSL